MADKEDNPLASSAPLPTAGGADEEDEEEDIQPAQLGAAGFGLDLVQYLLQSRLLDRNADTNKKMVQGLKKRKLLNKDTERAMIAVPRGDFLTAELAEEAYQDSPLRFAALGFNISAPHMYATCLEALNIQEGNTVLDVGSGCGHMTCLAGFLVGPRGKAHGLEIRQDIVDFGDSNKRKFEVKSGIELANTTFELRNCFIADLQGRTWDRIHVGACCPDYKLTHLQGLLNPGGILVTPYADNLIKVTKDAVTLQTKTATIAAVRYGDLIMPSEQEMRQAEIEAQRYRAARVIVPEDNLINDFSQLANNSKLSDVQFIVEDKIVYAHKFLLAFRCPYLYTLVQSVFSPSSTSNNNNNNTNTNGNSGTITHVELAIKHVPIDPQTAPAVLQAAVDFNLPSLMDKCQTYLRGNSTAPQVISENMREELASLVNTDRLADVVFIVEESHNGEDPQRKRQKGARVFGHRFILALRSEYFRSIFTTGMKESAQQEIAVPEVGKNEFITILRFVYTGDVAVVNEENVVDILEAANYFSETRLKCVCEDVLKRGAEIENVAYVLDVATRYEATQLRNSCIEFIYKNFEAVKKTKTFADIDRELLVELLSEACRRFTDSPQMQQQSIL